MAVVPDLLQLTPLLTWIVISDTALATVTAYTFASPGTEPLMPDWVRLYTHHLHCIMHSAVVAGAVTFAAFWWSRGLLVPLLGWWSHIVIDVFTHSADYYPSPVLYPFSLKGFDGIAWNEPSFMAVNYIALAVAIFWLLMSRLRRQRRVVEDIRS